jgi:hypothetical protein
VNVTGPCTPATSSEPGTVYLKTIDAGTCHVELKFGSGATSSIDLTIVSSWIPLGLDPHGCGQVFTAIKDTGDICLPSACKFPLPDRTCDAGH